MPAADYYSNLTFTGAFLVLGSIGRSVSGGVDAEGDRLILKMRFQGGQGDVLRPNVSSLAA